MTSTSTNKGKHTMFNTIESCEMALVVWQKHAAEFPSNHYYGGVVLYLKNKIKRMKNEATTGAV